MFNPSTEHQRVEKISYKFKKCSCNHEILHTGSKNKDRIAFYERDEMTRLYEFLNLNQRERAVSFVTGTPGVGKSTGVRMWLQSQLEITNCSAIWWDVVGEGQASLVRKDKAIMRGSILPEVKMDDLINKTAEFDFIVLDGITDETWAVVLSTIRFIA